MKKSILFFLIGLIGCNSPKQLKEESVNCITNFYFRIERNSIEPSQLVVEYKLNDTLVNCLKHRMLDSIRLKSNIPFYKKQNKFLTRQYSIGEIKDNKVDIYYDFGSDYLFLKQNEYDSILKSINREEFVTKFYERGGKICIVGMKKETILRK